MVILHDSSMRSEKHLAEKTYLKRGDVLASLQC